MTRVKDEKVSFGTLIVLCIVIGIINILGATALVWLAVEEVGQFTDLSFQEAFALGVLLFAAAGS